MRGRNKKVRNASSVAVQLFLSSILLLAIMSCESGAPSLVISGTVTDAKTGLPIAGAKVLDDGYGPGPKWDTIQPGDCAPWGAISDPDGKYRYLTWHEHHGIVAQADGYEPRSESLGNGHLDINLAKANEVTLDFLLDPE